MDRSQSDRNPRVSRREALLALGSVTVAGAAVAHARPVAADEPAASGAKAGSQPGYRETDHIRRFYDCARF